MSWIPCNECDEADSLYCGGYYCNRWDTYENQFGGCPFGRPFGRKVPWQEADCQEDREQPCLPDALVPGRKSSKCNRFIQKFSWSFPAKTFPGTVVDYVLDKVNIIICN